MKYLIVNEEKNEMLLTSALLNEDLLDSLNGYTKIINLEDKAFYVEHNENGSVWQKIPEK